MTSGFEKLFGDPPAACGEAPGRVNLIGEHTDYNGGFVLPTAIPQRTRVELSPRAGRTARVASASTADGVRTYTVGAEARGRGWLDYVQGATHVLRAAGLGVGGFDAWITSDVPLGSGLASSAALSVALLRGLRDAFALAIDDIRLARFGQELENQFVGAHVGVMDPMACSLAALGIALFLDTRSLAYERIALPTGGELVVINSGVAHRHAAGDYNTRRAECERAAALLGVAELRDLTPDDLPKLDRLPDPLGRRARHVITENARVLDTVRAMRAGDLEWIGRLFLASHASQRDDYQVSIPEIDLLVELAAADRAIYGARLTGGGFGGSIALFARAGAGAAAAQRLARAYADRTGSPPIVVLPRPAP